MKANRARPGRRGPLITLLAGTGLAAALLVASMVAAGSSGSGGDGANRRVAGQPSPSAAATESPSPRPEPASAPVEPEPVTYVGRVDGGAASVAIIVTGGEAVGYVCDGATAEAWLRGSAGGGYLQLSGAGGELVARYDADRVAGEVSLAGQRWSFTIAQVDRPEGLYRFADTIAGGAEVTGGWIVLPDGSQVGVLTVGGTPRPAPALDPATGTVTIDGSSFTAQRQG